MPDMLYDYSQPITISGNATLASQQIDNPFGTDAEVCVELVQINGAANATGFLSLGIDQPASTVQMQNTGTLGYIFPIPMQAWGSVFYIPVQQYVNVAFFLTAQSASFILTLRWRRERMQYVPQEVKQFGEPTE